MARPATAVAWRFVGARGGAVQAMLDGPDSPLPLKANTRNHTSWSLVSPASTNDGWFQGLVPAGGRPRGLPSAHPPPPLARPQRGPATFDELAVPDPDAPLELYGGARGLAPGPSGPPH